MLVTLLQTANTLPAKLVISVKQEATPAGMATRH